MRLGSLDAGSVAVLHGSGHAGDAGGLGVVHVCIVRVLEDQSTEVTRLKSVGRDNIS